MLGEGDSIPGFFFFFFAYLFVFSIVSPDVELLLYEKLGTGTIGPSSPNPP